MVSACPTFTIGPTAPGPVTSLITGVPFRLFTVQCGIEDCCKGSHRDDRCIEIGGFPRPEIEGIAGKAEPVVKVWIGDKPALVGRIGNWSRMVKAEPQHVGRDACRNRSVDCVRRRHYEVVSAELVGVDPCQFVAVEILHRDRQPDRAGLLTNDRVGWDRGSMPRRC